MRRAPRKGFPLLRRQEPAVTRILVVDDDTVIHVMLDAVLTDEGWLVDHAASGEDAIARCRADDFDIVVLDYQMPGLNGVDVARRLRRAGYPSEIVIFSAELTPDARRQYRALNLVCIDKVDIAGLVDTCRTLARQSRRPRTLAQRLLLRALS